MLLLFGALFIGVATSSCVVHKPPTRRCVCLDLDLFWLVCVSKSPRQQTCTFGNNTTEAGPATSHKNVETVIFPEKSLNPSSTLGIQVSTVFQQFLLKLFNFRVSLAHHISLRRCAIAPFLDQIVAYRRPAATPPPPNRRDGLDRQCTLHAPRGRYYSLRNLAASVRGWWYDTRFALSPQPPHAQWQRVHGGFRTSAVGWIANSMARHSLWYTARLFLHALQLGYGQRVGCR